MQSHENIFEGLKAVVGYSSYHSRRMAVLSCSEHDSLRLQITGNFKAILCALNDVGDHQQ